jgi:hypothetical protein
LPDNLAEYVRLPHVLGEYLDRGTWQRDRYGNVFVKCGRGHLGTLGDHTIHPDGRVEPSVECPQCLWHQSVILDGWAP